jgi:nucleotide-binding universal stress UspA family protein
MSSADGPVLFAYDGSDGARRAIAEGASRLAARDGVVVSVWRSHERSAGLGRLAVPDSVTREAIARLDAESQAEAAALAAEGVELLTAAGWAAEAATRSTTTNVWAAVLAVAREHGATTIVVGSRGMSGLKAVVLGSVSSALLQHSDVPVLLVN